MEPYSQSLIVIPLPEVTLTQVPATRESRERTAGSACGSNKGSDASRATLHAWHESWFIDQGCIARRTCRFRFFQLRCTIALLFSEASKSSNHNSLSLLVHALMLITLSACRGLCSCDCLPDKPVLLKVAHRVDSLDRRLKEERQLTLDALEAILKGVQ